MLHIVRSIELNMTNSNYIYFSPTIVILSLYVWIKLYFVYAPRLLYSSTHLLMDTDWFPNMIIVSSGFYYYVLLTVRSLLTVRFKRIPLHLFPFHPPSFLIFFLVSVLLLELNTPWNASYFIYLSCSVFVLKLFILNRILLEYKIYNCTNLLICLSWFMYLAILRSNEWRL